MNLRDQFAARLNAPPPPPLAAAAKFLRSYCSGADGLEEVREEMTRMAALNPRTLWEGLQGIEALLADPPGPGRLAWLVALEGNWQLEDPGDAGAAAWLRQLAGMIREVLGDQPLPAQ